MNFNRFTMLAVAALVTVASTGAASASVYDDAFSQDTAEKTAQVSAKAQDVHAATEDEIITVLKWVHAHQFDIDMDGSYRTYQKKTETMNYLKVKTLGEDRISFGLYRQGSGATGDGIGPSCTVNGVAKRNKDGYLFVEKNAPMGDSCRLQLRPIKDGIEIEQEGSCMYYCGAGMELDKTVVKFTDYTPSK